MQKYSKIIGTGSYLPKRIVTNDDLSKFVDTSDEWIRTRTGISQRHFVEKELCSDLAYEAAKRALNKANLKPQQLDAIILATTTPDKVFPSTACTVQHRLGANGCCAFDVQAVCAGFIYALGTADSFIRSGQYKNILVIGSDTISKLLNWQDRSTCVLFGDGAGAVVLTEDNKPGIHFSKLHADGRYEELLHAPYTDTHSNAEDKIAYLTMEGPQVYKIAIHEMTNVLIDTIKESSLSLQEIDWLIPHQANTRIIDNLAKNLKISQSKIILTIEKHANTSAASIPLAFDYGVEKGLIKSGQNCLTVAFGGGFSWGSAILKY